MELDNILKKIICEVKEDMTLFDKIKANTNLMNDIGLDSLQMVNFLLQIEQQFNLELDYDDIDLQDLQTYESVCTLINKLLAK